MRCLWGNQGGLAEGRGEAGKVAFLGRISMGVEDRSGCQAVARRACGGDALCMLGAHAGTSIRLWGARDDPHCSGILLPDPQKSRTPSRRCALGRVKLGIHGLLVGFRTAAFSACLDPCLRQHDARGILKMVAGLAQGAGRAARGCCFSGMSQALERHLSLLHPTPAWCSTSTIILNSRV